MMLMPTEEEKKAKAAAGGSQFADVSRYISQNQPQAQRLASTVGNTVVQAGNQARQANQNVQQNFNQQVQNARTPYNEAVANRAATDPRSFYQYQRPVIPKQTVNGANKGDSNRGGGRFKNLMPMVAQQAAPTQQVVPSQPMTQADVDEFQRMQKGEYTGPNDLTGIEGYGDLASKEAAAYQAAQNVTSDVGREDLLTAATGKPMNALDAMLLGGGDANGILEKAAAENAGISGMSDVNNEKAISDALAAKQNNLEGAAKIDELMYGPQGAFTELKSGYDALDKKRGGGKGGKQSRELQRQDYAQKLEALNRLMGTDYKFGGA